MMLDYDSIDVWAPSLSQALAPVVPESVRAAVTACAPRYIEDALRFFLLHVSREDVIAVTLAWLGTNTIAAYHGSRLSEDEVASIRGQGLMPLVPEKRRPRLFRALSPHAEWPQVDDRLDAAIAAYGQGNRSGHREGQVHLTLSRAGLVKKFDHYLRYGSEFDQDVAEFLLGAEGMSLLERDGMPYVVQVELSGEQALAGANQRRTVEECMCEGEMPNLVKQFLMAWSYELFASAYQSATRRMDCDIKFLQAVPPDCIRRIEQCGPAR